MNDCVKKLFFLAGIILATAGCQKMNDKHKSWLETGEIIYIGKVDSVKIFSGNERILFRYWISDPRVKTLNVAWSLGRESIEVTVPAHLPAEPFDLYIGRNEKDITEGVHTFNWVTQDQYNNKSVIFEITGNVYGSKYHSTLINRPLISAEADGTDVTLVWGEKISEDEVEVNVNYTTTSDVPVILRCSGNERISAVVNDVKLTAPVTYSTLYLPEPNAIDTFSTVSQTIDISIIR